jgi:hypothetical protein
MSKRYAKDPAVPSGAAAPAAKPITSNAVQATILGTYVSAPIIKKILGGSFYIALGAFVLFVFLVILHYTTTPVFSFGLDDTGVIAIPTPDSEQSYPGTITPTQALHFSGLVPYNYTFSMNCTLNGSFTGTKAPLVLLYRSDAPVAVPETTTEDGLPALFPASNFVLYVDPVRNDLRAVFRCVNGATPELPKPIQNIPIGTPFRITLAITCQYVEIYINGELNETVVLPDRLTDTTSNFYGPTDNSNPVAKVSNISYWGQILSSRVIRIKGAAPA